jgi:hypothetical protein
VKRGTFRNLKLFQMMCGKGALASSVVVTNMWGLLPDQEIGERRERELKADPEFFRPMIQHGARFKRHYGTKISAEDIILSLLGDTHKQEALPIQNEVGDNPRWNSTTVTNPIINSAKMIEKPEKSSREHERVISATTRERHKPREEATHMDYLLIAYDPLLYLSTIGP